jgi:excisionase family DNA binding protein
MAHRTAQTEELQTAEEIAKRYRVGTATVQRWTREGRIPCVRPSRRVVRYDPEAVERALERPATETATK